jgi:uncharacterized protein
VNEPVEPTTTPAPPRWKFAVIVLLGLYPTLIVVISLMSRLFDTPYLGLTITDWPAFLVRTLVTVLIVVPIMVWGAIPLLSRVLRSWLHP